MFATRQFDAEFRLTQTREPATLGVRRAIRNSMSRYTASRRRLCRLTSLKFIFKFRGNVQAADPQ
jgi:hypothetical protein